MTDRVSESAERIRSLAADIHDELKPIYHVTPGGLKWSKSTDAIRGLVAECGRLSEENEQLRRDKLAISRDSEKWMEQNKRLQTAIEWRDSLNDAQSTRIDILTANRDAYFDARESELARAEAAEADCLRLQTALREKDSAFRLLFDAVDAAQKIDKTGGDSAVSVALSSWDEYRAALTTPTEG